VAAKDILGRLEEAEGQLIDLDGRLEFLEENSDDDDEEDDSVTAADFQELTQRLEDLQQVCQLPVTLFWSQSIIGVSKWDWRPTIDQAVGASANSVT
jgi:hypothetical protein